MAYSLGMAPLLALFKRPSEDAQALQAAVRAAGWQTVVDLGAGKGVSALALAEIGCRVFAVEPDTEMAALLVATLAQRPELLPRWVWLPRSETLAAGLADGVLCQSVLHLLDEAAQDALLREAGRLLRPGAALWLEVPLEGSARTPRPWALAYEVELGGGRLQLHQRVDRGAGRAWFTDWRFELRDAEQRLLHQLERHWDWTPLPPEALRARVEADGWRWQGAFADWAAAQAFDPAAHSYGYVRLLKE